MAQVILFAVVLIDPIINVPSDVQILVTAVPNVPSQDNLALMMVDSQRMPGPSEASHGGVWGAGPPGKKVTRFDDGGLRTNARPERSEPRGLWGASPP